MQISPFVNTSDDSFQVPITYKTLHTVMISLFALLSLTIKWTRINSSTAWQHGKKHFMQTVCSILRNKLTKSFRSFYILNLRLQREHRRIKDENFFVYNWKGTILCLYSIRLRRLTQILAEGLRKTIFAVQWPTYLENYYPYCTAGGITRSLFGHARRYPDIHRGQTRHFLKELCHTVYT